MLLRIKYLVVLSTDKNIKNKISQKISTTWEILLAGFSIFGAGFSAGFYISKVISDIEEMEKTNKFQREIIQIQSDYETQLHQLRQNLYELQNKILESCKNEK